MSKMMSPTIINKLIMMIVVNVEHDEETDRDGAQDEAVGNSAKGCSSIHDVLCFVVAANIAAANIAAGANNVAVAFAFVVIVIIVIVVMPPLSFSL